MDPTSAISPAILLLVNVLLGLVVFFGGLWVRNIDANAKDDRSERARITDRMNQTELQLHAKFDGYVAKDEFRDFRREQSESFRRLFEVVDEIRERVAKKADRP